MVSGPYRFPSSSRVRNRLYLGAVLAVFASLISASTPSAVAQQASPQRSDGVTIRGSVLDAAGKGVSEASVRLEQKSTPGTLETKTNQAGVFEFPALRAGSYVLSAEKSGLRSGATTVIAPSHGDQKQIELVLQAAGAVDTIPSSSSSPSNPASNQAMEFADKPNFTVAGVTDWTAVGGHGSDSTLRASEALTRETLLLKPEGSGHNASGSPAGTSEASESESKLRAALAGAPESFDANHQLGEFYLHAGRYQDSIPPLQASYRIDPANRGNEYDLALACEKSGDLSQAREHVQNLLARNGNADVHRLAGEIDENLGDPLAAVHEDEQAVRMDPSEENYFAWGSELLLHRAVWQAIEVFRNGAEAYPKSARMLAALGTALFAGDLYDEAAVHICDASDLIPAAPEPYIFMGKVEMAAPAPLKCVEQRLSRFVQAQPGNALANYLYAMSIWKRQGRTADQQAFEQVEALLTKAVTIDPKCGDAYLQLGILYFSQRNFEKAIGSYNRAIEVDPQLGEAHYRLAVAYDRIGETAKAKQEFQRHDEIEKKEAAAIERQRREIKQFLVVLQEQPSTPVSH